MTGKLIQFINRDGENEELWWIDDECDIDSLEDFYKEYEDTDYDSFEEFMEALYIDYPAERVFVEEINI